VPDEYAPLPNESAEYRAARDELIEAEIEARRAIERAADLRRRLPRGGAVPENYVFVEAGGDGTTRPVRLSDLFEPGTDTLIVYSFMFGPEMQAPCPSCSSILDGLDGVIPHVSQRASVAVVAKSPIERITEFARARGWRHLRVVSSAANTYNRDYRGETLDGAQMPRVNVFVRDNEQIRHFWSSEELPEDEGQEPRNVDLIWPLWHLLDMTPAGRGTDEDFPRLTY
jgi:predicted dithiol-disulfide oxidoreductase (DUF899 family)